jgi:hypothetical protein
MSYRSLEQPLDIHLWFLCEFLIQSKVDMKPLQLYVVTACFMKIHRRMNDKNNVSKSYYDSLMTLNVAEFPEFSEPPPQWNSQGSKRQAAPYRSPTRTP